MVGYGHSLEINKLKGSIWVNSIDCKKLMHAGLVLLCHGAGSISQLSMTNTTEHYFVFFLWTTINDKYDTDHLIKKKNTGFKIYFRRF